MEAAGKSEEFDLLIQVRNRAELFRGKALSVRPVWYLHDFHARWKKEDGQHDIHVSWQESGTSVAGRWLVIIPLWRPWEDAILQYQFDSSERSGHNWHIPLWDLPPGRYIVKAVHAPWGCDDWIGAQAVCEQALDVYPESWPETFGEHDKSPTVELYFQSLLAYWYRPERVRNPLIPPSGLTADEIKRFLENLKLADMVERINIPHGGSGSINIFCANATATTEAYISLSNQPLAEICRRALPSQEIITLKQLNENDKANVK